MAILFPQGESIFMFKRVLVMIFVVLILSVMYFSSFTPVFNKYSNKYEVYLYDNGSNATILNVDKVEYYLLSNIHGESCKIESENFDVFKFFEDMGAEIMFIEQIEDVVCYYAFCSRIKYRKQVLGHTVNLHVAIRKSQITVGSPLIYGSF